MKTTTKEKELLIKGMMLGFRFSTEVLNEHFEGSFGAVMRNGAPPLPAILQSKIAEIFFDDNETKVRELYEWAYDNYEDYFGEVDVSYMKYVIDQVMAPRIEFKKQNSN